MSHGGEDSRAALVDAMARVCTERGYQEASVDEVLAASGCDRATFDRHFDGKEDCALAAVDAILADGMATVGAAYSPDTNEAESAVASLASLLELFAARPDFARLAFIEPRQGMPPSALQRYQSGFAILAAMLDRLREGSERPAQAPPHAARAAIGGGEALVRRELAAGRGDRLPVLLPALVYSAVVPFWGQREALRLAHLAERLLSVEE